MSDIPTPPPGVKLHGYADDLTTLTSHTDIETAQDRLQPYLQELHTWTTDNNLQLNADKSTSTLFTSHSAQYNTQLRLHINNTLIPTVQHPKILGLTLDPKLNYGEHIKTTKEKAQKTTNILKALTSTTWGLQKETLVRTYKAITLPVLEYASPVWSPATSATNIQELQTVQNTALRIATGCTADTNTQHLHEETHVLPLQHHLQLHATQLRQKAQQSTNPLNSLTQDPSPPRLLKQTIFHNNGYTTLAHTTDNNLTEQTINQNLKTIHTRFVHDYLANLAPNKVIQRQAPNIDNTEQTLPRRTRRILAQLRTGKSPILHTYKHKIDPQTHPSPLCPLCKLHDHTTEHLFTCPCINTQLTPLDLWRDPVAAAALLARWEGRLSDS
jgi:hypothetical protein